MSVPLDQQFRIEKKGIIEQRVPVLHPSGMEQHYFVTYLPVPTNLEDGAAIEQWIERMTFLKEDLSWLLQQTHAKFWCEAAFNKDFHSMLDSYLRYAPRPQRTLPPANYSFIPNGKELEDDVSRLMFMCMLRLSTHKESVENFFTPEGFGRVIYDNYIFDIPRLFDICAIYAINNKELLSKMIRNIFQRQPAYARDLIGAIESIKNVIAERIKVFHTQTGPKKLHTKATSGTTDIIDLLYYILDLSSTLNRFFSVYPDGRMTVFHEDFHLTLIQLFETFLRAYERAQLPSENVDTIEILEEAKYETMMLFNDLLTSCCVHPLVTNENTSENVELIIKIFSSLIVEKRFLAAYEDYFSLCQIIDLAHDTTGLLDNEQIKFYKDGVKQAIELHGTPSCKRKLHPEATTSSQASASNNIPAEKSINPNIQMIKDMLPHLEENYIQVCLEYYDNDTHRLLDAIFNNTVPEDLKSNLQTKTSATTATTTVFNENENPFIIKDTTILDNRSNIYDNDEFDIFNRENIDISRIHRGKKTRDLPADLDDKSHMEGMGERYARLALIEDETDGEYDDEYDDTYDDGIVDVRDKADTIDNEIEKNQNRLLGTKAQHFRQGIDDDEEEDEEDGENQAKRRNQFVENPEVVRERKAQQRAAWQQRHQPHRPHAEVQHDVVGSGRGRGQSSTVLHNRRWKGTHKSSHANHNRRDRAAQKANRGLLS